MKKHTPKKPQQKITAKKRDFKSSLKSRQEESSKDKNKGIEFGLKILDISQYEEVNFFQLSVGTNVIDIIPYEVTSDKHPKKLEKGEIDYLLDIWAHRRVGINEDSFVCLKKTYGKPCPICEEMELLKQKGDTSEELIESLKPKRRVFYNIIDVNDDDKTIQIYEAAHYTFERELIEEAEGNGTGECVVFADPEDGVSIELKGRTSKYMGREFVELRKLSFVERDEQYDESIIQQTYPLDAMLTVMSYDEIADRFFGATSEGVSTEDDEEDEERIVPKKKVLPKKRKDEEEEDEEEEDKKLTKSKQKGNKCPYGHRFGKECDEYDDCSECDIWDACADGE